jgi:hypothetical protein
MSLYRMRISLKDAGCELDWSDGELYPEGANLCDDVLWALMRDEVDNFNVCGSFGGGPDDSSLARALHDFMLDRARDLRGVSHLEGSALDDRLRIVASGRGAWTEALTNPAAARAALDTKSPARIIDEVMFSLHQHLRADIAKQGQKVAQHRERR